MRKSILFAGMILGAAGAGAQTPGSDTSTIDSSATYTGVYTDSFFEHVFSPCDVPGIGSGWAVRFRPERHAKFLRYGYGGPGMPPLVHFVRLRGRVSPPGHFGLGFQTREIVVDSVLEIEEKLRSCTSYEDLAEPWAGVRSSGAPIIGAAFTDDNRTVALLDREGFINVWNPVAGTLLKQFPSEDNGNLRQVAHVQLEFSPDGKRLAMAGIDGVVRVWNPVTGKRLATFAAVDTASGTVNDKKVVAQSLGLAFNRSGTLLANMIVGKIAFWSTITGKRVGTYTGSWTPRLLFIGDSSFIASADSGSINVYPRLGADPIWRIRSPVQRFDLMQRSPDGRWLVVKSWGDTAHVWSLQDGQPGRPLVVPHWYAGDGLAFSLDGHTVATGASGSTVYLEDIRTAQPVRSFRNYRNAVFKTWFTSDGKSVVSWDWGDTILRVVHLTPNTTRPAEIDWGTLIWSRARTPGAPLGSISGFVADTAHKPIVGADVWIFDGDHPGSAPMDKTTTNAAGRFLLQQIMVPHVTVRASRKGFTTGERYVHLPAEEADASMTLRAGDDR